MKLCFVLLLFDEKVYDVGFVLLLGMLVDVFKGFVVDWCGDLFVV